MKKLVVVFLCLLTLWWISGCRKGDTGPKGDTGATGAKGDKGDKGDQGSIGTANVSYSPWIKIDASKWNLNPATDIVLQPTGGYTDTLFTYHADITAPAITQGIKDSGYVLYYIKDSTVNQFNPSTGDVFQYFPSNVNNLAGSTDDPSTIYYLDKYPDITIGKIPLSTWWYEHDVLSGTTDFPPRSEFPPKTKFFIRYIVVPGGHLIGGRSGHPLQFKNYEEAKAYFHIPD